MHVCLNVTASNGTASLAIALILRNCIGIVYNSFHKPNAMLSRRAKGEEFHCGAEQRKKAAARNCTSHTDFIQLKYII